MLVNPFTPSFGVSPPVLAGRQGLIDEFGRALDSHVGSLGRSTVYAGARGVGKTVLLNAAEDEARSRGWVVISETARPGVLETLVHSRIPEALFQLDPASFEEGRKLSGISTPIGGVSSDGADAERSAPRADLRSLLEDLCALTESGGTGVLLSLDEIHRSATKDMREVAVAFQHLRRTGRNVAFVGAGLPNAIANISDGEVNTFIRRSERQELGRVVEAAVEQALQQPAEQAGRPFDPAALELAVEATDGYPFMIQLVGDKCFNTNVNTPRISLEDAEHGVATARRRIGSLVFEPDFQDLTDTERSFVLAMAHDPAESKMSDIAERVGINSNNAGVHRAHLITKAVIEATRHGYVTFTNKEMRTFLREHAAFEAQQNFRR